MARGENYYRTPAHASPQCNKRVIIFIHYEINLKEGDAVVVIVW
jgi:hypothetical protein